VCRHLPKSYVWCCDLMTRKQKPFWIEKHQSPRLVCSVYTVIIIKIIIILLTMFMVLSSWLSAGWPPALRPNQPIFAVSQPKDWLLPSADTIAIYYYYSARKLIHITIPRRVEGWVDLGTAVRVHNRAQGCISQWLSW